MLSTVVSLAMQKGGYTEKDMDVLISGDLLNQIISASFAARDFHYNQLLIHFVQLYKSRLLLHQKFYLHSR
ncbi:hypothetical protein [Lactobacillus taiwanensis]|uniref:hypothetical protein n=1 Tax=Lactobacillus taiwanensis TaxID=508451 RepID=UPI003D810596